MRTLTIIFLLISLTQLNAQSSELLIGTWICYHKELEDGTTSGTDFMGQEFTYSCNDLALELKSDRTGTESQGGLKFEYIVKDSLLQLGKRVYIIELLNKQELVIRDYDPDEMKLSVYRQKFRREQE